MEGTGFTDRWNGPGWRWWALLAGVALVLVAILGATLFSAILDERISALLTLALLGELVILSFAGSGMLTGTSRRMSRGGLQRETATIDTDYKPAGEREAERARDRERQDRRTIRAGIMALPVFLTFIYLLFR